MRTIRDADWKILRDLKPVLLERFCERGLAQIATAATATEGSAHDRYLAVFDLVRKTDKKLARAFNDLRRSNALLNLAVIHAYGLLTDEEYARFSEETRAVIESVSK